jgi:DNA invertase Pin-like site-specific DNA recombinase
MRKVSKLEAKPPQLPERKKVAAYARVSEEKGRTLHSLSAQISFYSSYIQKHREWQYAGVYADEGISGTTDNRAEFRRMLENCEQGKIDIILTKSISRFARNTVDLLETVRHLKELGIEVRFEKEGINSLSEDGELMLTLLASFAQEESRSTSENVKWAIRKGFEQGKTNSFCIYGYRWDGEQFNIVPEEAEVIRLIYDNFLKGLSAEQTEMQLKEMGIKSYTGGHFSNTSIRAILRQERYTGNMLLQKTYIENHITHKSKINRGELPMYYAENTHPAIINLEIFEKVQAEIARRKELGVFANWSINTTCFTSKVKCGNCGVSYRRSGKRQRKKSSQVYYIWTCQTKDRKGVSACGAKNIPERILQKVCAQVLGLEEFDKDEILLAAYASGNLGLYILGSLVAFLTAFYMFRLIFVAFFGSNSYGEEKAHENSPVMTVPLIILAVAAVLVGFVNSPLMHHAFGHFIKHPAGIQPEPSTAIMISSTLIALAGIGLAWLIYKKKLLSHEALREKFSGIYQLLKNKYYIDEIYARFGEVLVYGAARAMFWFDIQVVNGLVNGIAFLTGKSGETLRYTEDGQVQSYASYMMAGVLIMVVLALIAVESALL